MPFAFQNAKAATRPGQTKCAGAIVHQERRDAAHSAKSRVKPAPLSLPTLQERLSLRSVLLPLVELVSLLQLDQVSLWELPSEQFLVHLELVQELSRS